MSSGVTDRAAGTPAEATGRRVAAERFDLDAWRSGVTDRLLLFISVVGAILVLISVVQAAGRPEWWPKTLPLLAAYGLVLVLAVARRSWRRRIDYRIAAWGVLLAGYAAAGVYLAVLGLLGNGLLFLVALPALGLVLLGRRSGMVLALVSVAVYVFFGIAAATGLLADWLMIRDNTLEPAQWLSQGLSAGLALVVLIVLLVRFLAVQVMALAEARAATREMAEAHDRLQGRTEVLDRYSRLLETAAEISRQVSMVRASGDVLQKAAELMVERLDVERVTAYFVEQDFAAEPALSAYATGDEGDAAAEASLRLRPSSISIVAGEEAPSEPPAQAPPGLEAAVARAAAGERATSQAVLVGGAGDAAVPGPAPAERSPARDVGVALLLRAGARLSVVLHLSGVALLTGEGGKAELGALEVMADQLAGALENARIFEQAEARLRELGALQRHYTVEAWQQFVAKRGKTAYHWMPLGAPPAAGAGQGVGASAGEGRPEEPGEEMWRSLFERARAKGRPVNLLDEDSGRHLLALPVRLRDEVIGMLGFHRPRDAGAWQQEEIAAIEVVAGRMAFAAENLRLLEDAQRRAARDRQIEEIAGQVQGSLDPDNILKTAVRELSRALEAEWAAIEVTGPREVGPG